MASCPRGVDLFSYERQLAKRGYRFVVGIDEAGRGPLAGPVVAGAVVFDLSCLPDIPGVYDSKALTACQRFFLYDRIKQGALAVGLGVVDSELIDQVNIYRATQLAMVQALEALSHPYEVVLVDAMPLSIEADVVSVVKGDQRSFVIAAASIIAKVERDRMMDRLHEEYPYYGWNKNRGYPTRQHREAIRQYGLSPYHRRSFSWK